MANRYAKLHAQIAANPPPIDEQIAEIVSEIERYAAWRAKAIERNQIAPAYGTRKLHRLRGALITLQQVRDGQLVPAVAQENAP